MSLIKDFFQKIFHSSKPVVERPQTHSIPYFPRTEEQKELEERVWKIQLQFRERVLKERAAAQREWMAKYEKDEAERLARKKTAQGL